MDGGRGGHWRESVAAAAAAVICEALYGRLRRAGGERERERRVAGGGRTA